MSILGLSLAAALIVGDVPTRVSSEFAEKLVLRGTWEGTSPDGHSDMRLRISGRSLNHRDDGGRRLGCGVNVIDEGDGKFCMELEAFGKADRKLLGIYQSRGNGYLICFREASKGRPTRFRADDGCLLILRRVNPGK